MKKRNKTFYIGSRIKRRRRDLKISQEKLGEIVGVTYQQIQKYENGLNRVSAEMLHKIAAALDTDVSYFYEKPVVTDEAHERVATYADMKGLSPDEREVIRCLRAIDDEEYRKRFLLLLMSAAGK
ncbi:MAG: helix-turn-helix transcriptional regulator [Deltaproteobacteria bacterium]|nr:helix-turn-helix transcriptional regulator [Deltaproteobacteria bacterium]